MDLPTFTLIATERLDALRTALLVDPFLKLTLETTTGEDMAVCEKDPRTPLSWIFKLSSERHRDIWDIDYSITECILKVIFALESDGRDGIIARLATAFAGILSTLERESYEEDADDIEMESE